MMKSENRQLYPSSLTVDLSAIAENYDAIEQMIDEDCEIGVCVKADAYGLGVEQVAPKLYWAGARLFYVATPHEGAQIRDLIDDKSIRIAILNGLFFGAEDFYAEHQLTPILTSLEEIKRWQNTARAKGHALDCMIQFDIGMNRLGLDHNDTFDFMNNVQTYMQDITLTHVVGHFASSDEQDDNGLSQEQERRFLIIKERLEREGVSNVKFSLSNSGGIIRGYHYDSVRPGITLYGGQIPLPGGNNIKHVVTLTTKLLQIRKASPGDTVGYGATRMFRNDKILGTVSLGYADGFLRSNSNVSSLYWKEHRLPIVGRVSMDLCTVDLSGVPIEEMPNVGDEIEVLGIHQKIDDLAKTAGTISYEILTSLGKRCDRAYK